MKYNLNNKDELDKASDKLAKLAGQHAIVEIKKISPKRSLNQNSYYYLILAVIAVSTGYTPEEVKQIHKTEISPGIFMHEKKGRTLAKSTRDLDTKQFTSAIDQLRMYAGDHGIDTPLPDEKEKMMWYENLIEENQYVN